MDGGWSLQICMVKKLLIYLKNTKQKLCFLGQRNSQQIKREELRLFYIL